MGTWDCLGNNRPKCPSADKQVHKMWYIRTMEYYLAIKRNGVVRPGAGWKNLESVRLNERRRSQKIHLVYDSIDGKHPVQANLQRQRNSGCLDLGRGREWHATACGYGVSFGGDTKRMFYS